jgi:membrane protein implicated in regulation of membrane protease activity
VDHEKTKHYLKRLPSNQFRSVPKATMSNFFRTSSTQTLKPHPANAQPMRQDHRHFSGEAVVDEEIAPHQRGMVFFHGSWWFAQCNRAVTLVPEQRVQVLGVRGTTLIVQPLAYW